MSDDNDIRAKLSSAEAELKRLRDAAELNNTVMTGLKNRIVRAEIAARRPVDVEAVEALISRKIMLTDIGEIVAMNESGNPAIGDGPDWGDVSLTRLLDQIVKDRPGLFEGAEKGTSTGTGRTGSGSRLVTDPQDPRFNLTAATLAARNDPELHRELMARLAPQSMRF